MMEIGYLVGFGILALYSFYAGFGLKQTFSKITITDNGGWFDFCRVVVGNFALGFGIVLLCIGVVGMFYPNFMLSVDNGLKEIFVR